MGRRFRTNTGVRDATIGRGRRPAARVFGWAIIATVWMLATTGVAAQDVVRIGSKHFNESYILAEIFAQMLEHQGFTVERQYGLGGTMVCYEALESGEIDVYPEYTGTITQAILQLDEPVADDALPGLLAHEHNLEMLPPLGFNNTYAIALTRKRANQLGIDAISDLADHPDLRLAFSYEFIERGDGWRGLADTYDLPQTPTGIEHGLAYQAIAGGKIDVTDVYSTDGDIERYDLFVLDDDRNYFPRYLAVPLARPGMNVRAKRIIASLAGKIDDARMRAMNAEVVVKGKTFDEVASAFLVSEGIGDGRGGSGQDAWSLLWRRTLRHLELTAAALVLAMLLAIPAGVVAYRSKRAARPVVYVAGALQTIPSIALLAFMIPLFGIGAAPAVIALFLYGLLPILRNTTAALQAVDPVIKRVATGMGLTSWQRLRHVEFPLALPTVLAGVKTAAVINIGTATLAAFIGAGGLGEPIVTGLALNDTHLIMQGAVPAAILAILTELLFELIDRVFVPRHLTR